MGRGQGSIANSYGSGNTMGRERLMLVPGMRVCLVIGSHVSALGFRRRELCGCHGGCARPANVRIVMGGPWSVRAQGRLLRGLSEIAAACISVSRRPHAASCMKAHWPACSLGRRSGFVVLPQGYLPHRQGRASARLLRSQPRACFVCRRLWAIRRSEQRLLASVSCRGRRRQGTRVQGSWVHRRRLVCRHRS
jgi:hypothetical protein